MEDEFKFKKEKVLYKQFHSKKIKFIKFDKILKVYKRNESIYKLKIKFED